MQPQDKKKSTTDSVRAQGSSGKEPTTAGTIIRTIPDTFVSGASTAIGTWFGANEIVEQLNSAKRLKGRGGKKVIPDVFEFKDDLRQIVHYWKALDADTDHISFPLKRVVEQIEEVTKKYGLNAEAEVIKKWAKENEGKLDSRNAKERNELYHHLEDFAYDNNKHPFFSLFTDAVVPQQHSLHRAYTTLQECEPMILEFRNKQHYQVLNQYRLPATIALTLATMVGVGVHYARQDRKEKSFAARIDQLESDAASGKSNPSLPPARG